MAEKLRRVRNAAVSTALRIKMKTPIEAYFMAAFAGYLMICLIVYAGIVG